MTQVVVEIQPSKHFWKQARLIVKKPLHVGGFFVPVDFPSDGATIPWPLRLFLSPIGDYLAAAILHDWLLFTGRTRDYADKHFKSAMEETGVSTLKRAILYGGVRLWSKLRKLALPAVVVALVFFAIGGCAAPPAYDPDPWTLGPETTPPIGCQELRERDPEANC